MNRFAAAILSLMVMPSLILAHCEIPCGIYGDEGRFSAMLEDVTTIEKSMTEINALSGAGEKNFNQIVRWVNNKEKHADHIREVVGQYFLAQRIKEPAGGDAAGLEAYTAKLVKLHQIIRTAMKCKQTSDVANAKDLHDLIHEFQEIYTSK
jgi:nickel superoxide dismutase